MYESPINIIYGQMQMALENEVFKAVQDVNVEVDRDELIMALQYDRGQYEKGFVDGRAAGARDALEWISVKERLPGKSGQYYVSGGNKVWICKFLVIPNFTGGWCNDASNPVVQAWMPLPEPPGG